MRAGAEHGAAGLIVSNHGGRQLDGVPATLDLLPEVVEAVDGRCEVLVDGGVRRGTDVVDGWRSALGRCWSGAHFRGLAAGGEQGALRVLKLLRAEIELALILLGCSFAGGRARRARPPRAYIRRLDWPNGIHARLPCAASTA